MEWHTMLMAQKFYCKGSISSLIECDFNIIHSCFLSYLVFLNWLNDLKTHEKWKGLGITKAVWWKQEGFKLIAVRPIIKL